MSLQFFCCLPFFLTEYCPVPDSYLRVLSPHQHLYEQEKDEEKTLHPNISINIFHTLLYTLLCTIREVLTRGSSIGGQILNFCVLNVGSRVDIVRI